MKVDIWFMRFEHRFGRMVAMAKLFAEQEPGVPARLVYGDSPLSVLLSYVATEKLELLNAHQILNTLVIEGGYAS